MDSADRAYVERLESTVSALFAITNGLIAGMSRQGNFVSDVIQEVISDADDIVREARLRLRNRLNGRWEDG